MEEYQKNRNERDSLLERAMLTLDDYLNAGCKATRKQAAENAKYIYKEYYGVGYINRNERQIKTKQTIKPNAELTDAGPVTPGSRETQSRHSVQ